MSRSRSLLSWSGSQRPWYFSCQTLSLSATGRAAFGVLPERRHVNIGCHADSECQVPHSGTLAHENRVALGTLALENRVALGTLALENRMALGLWHSRSERHLALWHSTPTGHVAD